MPAPDIFTVRRFGVRSFIGEALRIYLHEKADVTSNDIGNDISRSAEETRWLVGHMAGYRRPFDFARLDRTDILEYFEVEDKGDNATT